MNRVRVWDLPTRVFHWSLVICFAVLLASAELGGDAMRWHFWAGYCVFSLLLFRLAWGFVGGQWSRFSSFLPGPSELARYLTRPSDNKPAVGHNPLGALSVVALLLFAAIQVATGLLSDDEIATSGPLSKMASSKLVNWSTFYHADIGKWVLIGLVLLHIAAILVYLLKKGENLVSPMLWGDKVLEAPVPSSRDDWISRCTALCVFATCLGGVILLVTWAG